MENTGNIQQDESDVVQHCGRMYKENFIDTEIRYRINFFAESSFDIVKDIQNPEDVISVSQNTINEIEIIFTPLELKHLAGIGKFPDIHKQDRPQAIYEKMLGIHKSGDILTLQDIRESDFFFDDIDRTQNEETVGMTDEEFQKKIEAERLANRRILKSDFISRLNTLENLNSTIQKSNPERSDATNPLELKIYFWDKTKSRTERPHDSKINADFLIEIYNRNNSDKPYTQFFVVIDKENNTYKGMSTFSSEHSYAKDEKGRQATKITALSIEKTELGQEKTVVYADDKTIAQCQERARKHEENIRKEVEKNVNKEIINEYIDRNISRKRSEIIKKNDNLDSRNPKAVAKFILNQSAYYKLVETKYFDELSVKDLSEIKNRLSQTLADTDASSAKWKCICYEINTMDSRITVKKMLNELEQLLQQEDFSIDAYADKLSAVSAYLTDRSVNVGRDLVLKVADLIERQKESCDEFTAELIDDEVKEIKRTAERKPEDRISFGQSGSFSTAQFHISLFTAQDNAMSLAMPFEAVLNGIADSFNQLQESVIEKIHDFVNRVKQAADSIMNTVSAKFQKKQEQDTKEPSVSVPETENENTENKDTEKDSNNDSRYIIIDGAGIQSYGDYFTVVSASELDFHVPLTYKIQQQHEKQQVEQEVSEEKTPAPEHRKKQAEYDDS